MNKWTLGQLGKTNPNEPKRTQNEPKTNPNSKRPKINVTTCLTMNYEQRTINDEKKRTQNEPNFRGK